MRWKVMLHQLRRAKNSRSYQNKSDSYRYQCDKRLRAKHPVIAETLPCMNGLNDRSVVHFQDKGTAMRKAPRLCAAAPNDGT